MILSTMVKAFYRLCYGEPPDLITNGGAQGLILVADGVGGLDLCGMALRYVIGSQDKPFTVQVIPWGHGLFRWHADLTNAENRDQKALEVANAATEFRERTPGASVFLVGKSGGTGVIVKALELLPENSVEVVVLLSPALSLTYDLSLALRAVRREMVVFWSPIDMIVLGAGTRIFGTIDRVKSVSAGMTGFRIPEGLNESQRGQYGKLRQVRWKPAMVSTGYFGGHMGTDNPAFLRKYVVPLLRVVEPPPC